MINTISSVAPKKDLQKYYIRDAIGQLARICNGKVKDMFKYEYAPDVTGVEFAKEYFIYDDDGWMFANTYLTRVFVASKKIIVSPIEDIFNHILENIVVIINHGVDESARQMKINSLQDDIRKYTKKNSFKDFSKDADYLICKYNHNSLLGFSIIEILLLIVLNEYYPYDISYIDSKNRVVNKYLELRYNGGIICDFRDTNLEQSAIMGNADISKFLDKNNINRDCGKMEDFNVAFSGSMLNSINKNYGHLFSLNNILDESRAVYRKSKNRFGDDYLDCNVQTAARYCTGIYRLFKYVSIDANNETLVSYLNENKNKWHFDLYINNKSELELFDFYYLECVLHRLSYIYDGSNIFDVTNRSRLFTNGVKIKYTSECELLKDKDIEFFIYEYIYNNKLNIFISIKTVDMFNYYVVREGDYNIFMQCYNGYDMLLLASALYLIGNEDFDRYLTYKMENGLEQIFYNETSRRNMIFNVPDKDEYFLPYKMIRVLEEAHNIMESDKEPGNNSTHNKRVYVSEMYSETIKMTPFIRKLPIGMHPSDDAIKLAAQLRINLPAGYTVVREHTKNVKKKASK